MNETRGRDFIQDFFRYIHANYILLALSFLTTDYFFSTIDVIWKEREKSERRYSSWCSE